MKDIPRQPTRYLTRVPQDPGDNAPPSDDSAEPDPLPWGRVFFGDLLGLCHAREFTLRQYGILFRLLAKQHLTGAVPAELAALQQWLGDAATPSEVREVVRTFFPRDEDGQRRNPQAAAARTESLAAHEATRAKGRAGAVKRWRKPPPSEDG